MPSTLVHLAFAGLLASALLGNAFGLKALAVVFVVVAVPDLDSFITLSSGAGHRTLLHNIWVPLVGAIVVWVDLNLRDHSLIEERWGEWGVRVAWVSLVCYVFAHLLLDLADGSINLFWPVYDQFYTLRGVIEISDQRGIVQTFSSSGLPLLEARGTTDEVLITTGVDPGPSENGEPPERVFPVFRAGWELALFVVGTVVTATKLVIASRDEE